MRRTNQRSALRRPQWVVGLGALLAIGACLNPMPEEFPSERGNDSDPVGAAGSAAAPNDNGAPGAAGGAGTGGLDIGGATGGSAGSGGASVGGNTAGPDDASDEPDAGAPDAGGEVGDASP